MWRRSCGLTRAVAVADSSFGSRSRVDSLERDQSIVAFFTPYLNTSTLRIWRNSSPVHTCITFAPAIHLICLPNRARGLRDLASRVTSSPCIAARTPLSRHVYRGPRRLRPGERRRNEQFDHPDQTVRFSTNTLRNYSTLPMTLSLHHLSNPQHISKHERPLRYRGQPQSLERDSSLPACLSQAYSHSASTRNYPTSTTAPTHTSDSQTRSCHLAIRRHCQLCHRLRARRQWFRTGQWIEW